MWRQVSVLAATVLVLVACGGEETSTSGDGGGVDTPCALADAAMVEAVFGGTVAEGVEGPARDCDFELSGGPVANVQVFEFGPSSQWAGLRSGYEDNRGGAIDVDEIGDEAFYPGDVGPVTLVVRAGGQNFAVDANDAFSEPPPGTEDLVAELARAIVTRLEG